MPKQKNGLLDFDPTQDGMYRITSWSGERILTRDRIRTIISSTQTQQPWFDTNEFTDAVANQTANGAYGRLWYLIDYAVDNHESPEGTIFPITIAESSYAEFLATSQLLKQHPDIRDRIAELLDQNPKQYACQACPSSIDINVVVLSQEDNFLAFRRSSAVGTEKKLWTAGPNEAMKLPESPDLFGLAEHCLREELALEPPDYDGHIVISWLGFNKDNLQAHAVAQVRLAISEDELRRRAARAKNNFEHDCLQWLPFNEASVSQFLADRSGPLADRKWLDQEVRLALYETWRMRDLLPIRQTHGTVAAPSIQKPDGAIDGEPAPHQSARAITFVESGSNIAMTATWATTGIAFEGPEILIIERFAVQVLKTLPGQAIPFQDLHQLIDDSVECHTRASSNLRQILKKLNDRIAGQFGSLQDGGYILPKRGKGYCLSDRIDWTISSALKAVLRQRYSHFVDPHILGETQPDRGTKLPGQPKAKKRKKDE